MPRILVVDDEPMLRRTVRAILEREGHVVVEAEDGHQAVKRFTQEGFDLVITDIVMPNREGVETIGDLRRLDPALPIIAISGGGAAGPAAVDLFLQLADQLGAMRTLAKPIRQTELIEAVNNCLRRRDPPEP